MSTPTEAFDGHSAASKNFRHIPALDGLRGLAVVAVVLYHFVPDLVPAGFIGVDVFLVLSGFLITSLALDEVGRTSTMSASGFFSRRARRLLPAAVATIGIVVIVARLLDHGSVTSGLRGQAVASLTYVANWWSIAQNNSYQAAFGAESPLNHFWSLAVEEQFYLVFPLALIGTIALLKRRIGLHRLAHVALIAATIGAIASCALMWILRDPGTDPSRVYFGTDTRSQALFVGIAIACVIRLRPMTKARRQSELLLTTAALLGLAALVAIATTASFRSDWLYTGGFLLIALMTGIVVLTLNGRDSLVTRALSMRWLRTLGVVSYGLYLWHWPIKVFVTGQRLNLSDDFAGRVELFLIRVALTAMATALSWYVIEQPFRRKKVPDAALTPDRSRTLNSLFLALGAFGITAMVVGVVWIAAKPPPPAPTDFSSQIAPSSGDEKGADSPISLLWFGDSVAWTMGGGIVSFPWPTGYDTPFDPAHIVIWNKAIFQCPIMQFPTKSFDIVRDVGGPCVNWEVDWRAATSQFSPDAIIWSSALRDTYDVMVDGEWITFGSARWIEIYTSQLEKASKIAEENGVPLVLVAQPDPKPFPDEQLEDSLLAKNIFRFSQLREMQRDYAAKHSSTTVLIDLQEVLCPAGPCETTTPAGESIRPDNLHFSIAGAKYIAPRVTTQIEQALNDWYRQQQR